MRAHALFNFYWLCESEVPTNWRELMQLHSLLNSECGASARVTHPFYTLPISSWSFFSTNPKKHDITTNQWESGKRELVFQQAICLPSCRRQLSCSCDGLSLPWVESLWQHSLPSHLILPPSLLPSPSLPLAAVKYKQLHLTNSYSSVLPFLLLSYQLLPCIPYRVLSFAPRPLLF